MPVYTYRCDNCQHRLETQQRITDNPLTHCPSCETNQLRRTINPVAVTFKGAGFYKTDAA